MTLADPASDCVRVGLL
ncbi:hypothetical protein A2U01_0068449 [Trifolium medium]|uniref:Uncharacterized protein n=1 Tax=Trifolium medium TaxID=97028 RepID=A0A392SEA0_9FABA|nr:hypothetical protein [Trifolium medium]